MPNVRLHSLVFLAIATGIAPAATADSLCPLLREFVRSVKPQETKSVTLRTSWGRGFSGMEEGTLAAKACERGNDTSAIKLCDYWMEHSSTEFAGINAMHAIRCLSPGTNFASGTSLNTISIHFTYGSANRGSLVDITLREDTDMGGMALKIEANGY